MLQRVFVLLCCHLCCGISTAQINPVVGHVCLSLPRISPLDDSLARAIAYGWQNNCTLGIYTGYKEDIRAVSDSFYGFASTNTRGAVCRPVETFVGFDDQGVHQAAGLPFAIPIDQKRPAPGSYDGSDPLPTVRIDVFDITQLGAKDGIILIEATGGTNDFSYSIDGGVTWSAKGMFGKLPPGSYRVMVQSGSASCPVHVAATIKLANPTPE